MGDAVSIAPGVPAVMMASVPAAARVEPPETGESTSCYQRHVMTSTYAKTPAEGIQLSLYSGDGGRRTGREYDNACTFRKN